VVSFLGASSEQATGCGVSIVVPSADSGLSWNVSRRYAWQYLEASSSSFLISELIIHDENRLVSILSMICGDPEPKNSEQGVADTYDNCLNNGQKFRAFTAAFSMSYRYQEILTI
jgi:hypothetical protein